MAGRPRNYNRPNRVKTAEENKARRAKRTPQQQLKRLDQLLGKDQGAQKERARLQAQIEAKKVPPKEKKK